MKMEFKTTMKCAIMTLSLFLAACTADVYEPKPEPTPEPGPTPEKGIPDDFNFSTLQTRSLYVNVFDEYDGKYYYTVEVFDADPITDPKALLLVGGKANSKYPFKIEELVLPEIQEYIYIKKTDPQGYSTVVPLEVKEGDLVLDYVAPVATKSLLRSDSGTGNGQLTKWLEPLVDEKIENMLEAAEKENVLLLSSNGTIEKNKSYKITGTVENLTFPEDQSKDRNYTLYVLDGATLDLESTTCPLDKNSQIVVFPGGRVIGSGATLQIGATNSQLVNMGEVNLKKIEVEPSSNSFIYNHLNSKIIVDEMHFNGGELHNHCMVKVNTFSFAGSASGLYLNTGSSLIVNSFLTGRDTKVAMGPHSLFETNELSTSPESENARLVVEDGSQNQFGDANSAKLFKVNGVLDYNYVSITGFFWSDLYTYAEEEKNYSANKNLAQRITGDKCPVNIEGKCFGDIVYKKDDSFTGGSTDPGYKPDDPSATYTYLFEDNWPSLGDYDMNDLVATISILNENVANNTVRTSIKTNIEAVGATKALYVFAKIDGTDHVFNLLGGEEVHSYFGASPNEMVNTYKENYSAREYTTTVDVKGMTGQVTANNLNVFVVWGDPNASKRNEIHIAGFIGTEYAATASTSTPTYQYKHNADLEKSDPESNNMMWGLLIPRTFVYPKETASIQDAYPDFKDWAISGGTTNQDWYLNGVEGLLYSPSGKY